ncbi:MAG: helix-turn-helix transcriptional regulator [Alphaproteobacteria bacterium]|nr:helix-turn-helix transcriptional regulator [Alphaproteobacteria bacterium]
MHLELVSPTEVWLQAAIASGSWRSALDATACSLNAGAVLLAWSRQGGGIDVEASVGSPPEFVRLCRDLARNASDGVLERQDTALGWLTWSVVQRLEQGQRIALFVLSDDRISHQALQTMATSAANAVITRADLDAMRMTSSLMTQACDQLSIGLVIVDASMKIVAHNESWRNLLTRRDGLSAVSGKLVCRDRGDQNTLAAAVATVLEGQSADATVRARRARGAEPYVLRVSTANGQGDAPSHCLLLVVDPDQAPAPNGDIWRAMFELTECELIIAEALLSGGRISEVATRRGVSRETVRSQTKRMFARLGVSSQVEAVVRLRRTTPFRPAPVRGGA